MILSIIKKNFPGDAILAEESGGAIGSEITWIIDPLDGTTNFFHGLPIFTVSISLQDENEIKGAVIYDPNRNEMFHAVKGEGAFLNGRPIHVSDAQSLSMSLLATGFPYNKREVLDFIAETVKRALFHCHCLRRCGVATIDLAYVGCGRLDGFFEEGLKPWDISAGILLVREAGGRVTDYSGQPIHPLAKTIVASNEKIHDQILQRILMEAGWRSPEAAH
jgi:myo-inositol-1(or 4)-monophosphatase